jgi:hypothetical protein
MTRGWELMAPDRRPQDPCGQWPPESAWSSTRTTVPGSVVAGIPVAGHCRADLIGVCVECGQHRLGVVGSGGLPVAAGQGDQAAEEHGDDSGLRVGARVDSLAFGERSD